MNHWSPRPTLEAELQKLDERIKAAPDVLSLLFDRAVLLTELGRYEEAKTTYLEILQKEHTHFGTLNNLGALLATMGFQSAARTAYAEAVKHHPHNPMGHINLANALVKIDEIAPALEHFRIALRLAPDHPEAHQGLSYVLTNLGDEENAMLHRQLGFKNRPIMVLPYRGEGVPIALLLLASAMGKAVPIQHHLDDKAFFTSVLFVEFYDNSFPFPPHHLVFNAIGDADIGSDALQKAAKLLEQTPAPIINHPAKVLATGRAANAKHFANIPGMVTPKILTLPRNQIHPSRHGISFPFLLRSPGFHTGKFFVRIHDEAELAATLPNLPGAELMMIEYLDTRGKDGKFRKYRVMMIDGKIYPLHAAVSHDWKVHYFSADMAENPEHRAEDEAFLNDMQATLGPRAMQALEQLCTALGLDYAGADFSLNDKGDVVLFEANATMFADLPGPESQWAYRHAPAQRIMDAIRALLTGKAQKNLVTTKLSCP